MINKNNKKGFVLILSLVMLIGMSVTGLILLNIANDKVVKNSMTEQNYQSFYAAQTGIFVGQELLTDLINITNRHQNNVNLVTPATITSINVTSQSTSITDDRWVTLGLDGEEPSDNEFGLYFGIDYMLNDNIGLQINYNSIESPEDVEVSSMSLTSLSFGLSYKL